MQFLSPDFRRFRSRFEVKKYLDEYLLENVSVDMFDFALHSKRRRGVTSTPKQPTEVEKPMHEETQDAVKSEPEINNFPEEGKSIFVMHNL